MAMAPTAKSLVKSCFLPLALLLILPTGCGKETDTEIEPDMIITRHPDHSIKQEQLEINSDDVQGRKPSKNQVVPPAHEPINEHLYQLFAPAEQGKAELAIKQLEQEIKENPKYGRAYCYLGKAYREKEDYKNAIAAFGNAIRYAPDDAFPYCLRAEAYYSSEKYDKAIEDTSKALKIANGYENAHSIRGEAFLAKSEYKSAVADLRKSSSLNPSKSNIFIDLGDAYFNLGSYESAISAYTKAINLDKDNGAYFARRAKAHKKLGKDEEFQKDNKRAMEFGFQDKSTIQ